jgi:RuvB-like protein 2
LDLLDRLMIIPTSPYPLEELNQILQVRCTEEQVEMMDDALELLTRIAKETSLRYAIHMIMTSSLVAKKRKSAKVEIAHLERCHKLFYDVQRSTKFIMEYQNQFLFHELDENDGKQPSSQKASDNTTEESKMEE